MANFQEFLENLMANFQEFAITAALLTKLQKDSHPVRLYLSGQAFHLQPKLMTYQAVEI